MSDLLNTDVVDEEAIKSQNEENKQKLRVVSDIPLDVTCVLGTTSMTVSQMLKLGKGSVIELDRNIGEPIDLVVNGKLVAKGEVVIVEDRIGITLTEIIRDNNSA